MMKMRNWLITLSIAFVCCLALVSQADAKVKLVTGQSKIDGVVITDGAGNPIATKRIHVIWRYEDTNLDGTFTWVGFRKPETAFVWYVEPSTDLPPTLPLTQIGTGS